MIDSGVPAERWDWIDRFVRAIESLEFRKADEPSPLALLTLEEFERLEFLRWRLEHGRVPD